jgi:hypothetical protein
MKLSNRIVLLSATLGIALAAFAGTQQASAAFCPHIVSPVCAVSADGARATFANSCFAHRAGGHVLHHGGCVGPVCSFDVNPVCARNVYGLVRTFSNLCWSEIENAVVLHNGVCF